MSAIVVSSFTKCYENNIKAVDNISFSLIENSIVGFVGKNGAGKSTTLRAMLNFIAPTSGQILVHNLDSVKDNVKIKERVSYLPSEVAYYDGLTGRELIDFCLKFTSKTEKDALELANYFELDLNKIISNLSLGNRKKVGIITAFLKDSDIFVFDEPTNGLDPIMQEKFFEMVTKKKACGATIFLSSHNLIEIEKYCDRVIMIKDGKIFQDINMHEEMDKLEQWVHYVTKDGKKETFQFSGDPNELIKKLSNIDLSQIEIKNASVEEKFIKYYQKEGEL